MKKIRMHIAYDGTAYHGWQIQPEDRTVEGELTRAVQKILGLSEPIKVQGSSRTDAGVHAIGQVAHFSHDSERTLWAFARGLNALTPDDVVITRVEEVDPSFHARHSARGKIYRYRLWNHRLPNPFERHRSWHVPFDLDLEAMRQAAAAMVGTHDFSAFRAADCQGVSPVREMKRVEVEENGSMVEIVVEGSAFLKYMVRIITGTLVDVGTGQIDRRAIGEILLSGERSAAGQTAPAHGLTLEKIHYPDYPWEPEPELGARYIVPRVSTG
jgi:tRNA pseudouridine38-40 synthase